MKRGTFASITIVNFNGNVDIRCSCSQSAHDKICAALSALSSPKWPADSGGAELLFKEHASKVFKNRECGLSFQLRGEFVMHQFVALSLTEASPLLAASIRRMLWNLPPLYAIGGTVLIVTIVGLWAASRW